MSWIRVRNLERIFLLLIAGVLTVLFMKLFAILKFDFEGTQKRLADGSMINLNDVKPGERMRSLLNAGYYFEDPKDINLAAQIVTQGFINNPEPIENIGALNKRSFNVPTEMAFAQGGESYRKRALLSRALIGFTGEDSLRFQQEKSAPPSLPSTATAGMGSLTISGNVSEGNEKPVPGVLVRLQMILPSDSLYNTEITEVDSLIHEKTASVKKTYITDALRHRQLQSMSMYARTDNGGNFSFSGLAAQKTYEVLPLKPAFEFGSSKGISSLQKNLSLNFYQKPHSIRLFSNRDFNNLKKDKALLVRTPEDVIQWIQIIAVSFFVAFLFLHLLLTFRFPKADQLILPVIMLLTGISFLTLLSLQDPLRDRFLAQSTFWYFVGGFVGICILLFFDLRRFTNDSGLYRAFILKQHPKAANGWPWAIAATALLILTILFGTGPEGSGVKVNLFGFQPSEIVKFFLILFLAGFFTTNEKFISEYTRWQKRWSFFSFALISIVGSILLFLILGDLGPAMVLCFTFIVLFSFSRGDFVFTVATAVTYVLLIWILQNIWVATAIIICLLILSSFFIRKGLSESSVMVIVVMAGFLLLDQIPSIEKVFP
ncbi:MAG TPA: FtsW/RodA/SpoVE family cell cycle protein, partial [Flavitalea sp.]|nr:FtsW/RodA/SpoVE family cell cycle protein [Flavitalea sp.]